MAVTLSKCRYVLLAANISTVYIALGLLLSLQPPFYPSEAEKMGATPAEYGFVFGIANLSLFIFSPIFGKYGSRIGAKLCFTCGAILQGVSGFLFAFLPYTRNVGWFIGLSYLLRFLEGMGTAMAWSAALGILMEIFPNNVAKVMSWTQTCFGLGYMMGPALGAALYEAGGFLLPFLVVGAISTILSISLIFTIPKIDHTEEDAEDAANRPQLRIRTVVTSCTLFLPFVDLFSALCGNGMLESMLEPHLRDAHADTMEIGISFLLFGCCYMLGNIFFGGVMDKLGVPILFSMLGNGLFMCVFLFVGPVPFMPFEPSKRLIQGMMALAGIAYASLVVSSFSRAQKRVLEMGFADDTHTHVMISGIWMSAFALGNFAGPTVAGFIVQTQGFRNTTILFFVLYVVMLVVDAIESMHVYLKSRQANEYEQLE